LFTSLNPARVLGGKNIISKQPAIAIVSEEAGKRLNRNHTERADARILLCKGQLRMGRRFTVMASQTPVPVDSALLRSMDALWSIKHKLCKVSIRTIYDDMS
jgi:hypothetical protein